MEHRASVKARKAKEVHIPFGVRAIESGIEVDGVWVSRSNTPDTVRQGSPSSSTFDMSKAHGSSDRLSTHSVPKLEMPQPTRGRARLAMPTDSSHDQSRASTSPEAGPRGRPPYQPKRSSALRYSNSQDAVDMATVSTFQYGRPANAYPGTYSSRVSPHSSIKRLSQDIASYDKTSPTASSKSSEGSGKDEAVINVDNQRQSAADILFDPAYLPPGRPRTQQVPRPSALDSLPSNHRPEPSETNHLLPHAGLSDVGMDWTPTQPDMETSHILQRQFSWEHEPETELMSDPFKTPVGSPLRGSVADGQQFTSLYTPDLSSTPVSEQRIEYLGDEALPTEKHQDQAEREGYSHRRSQVVRKVNSGFEILRPGTLDQQRRSTDTADAQWDEEAGQKRQSRKLQRKRASSGRSSIFQEQI